MSVAGVAHPVERHLAKVEVASSSLVTRSKKPFPFGNGFFFCSAKARTIQSRGGALTLPYILHWKKICSEKLNNFEKRC